MPCLITAFEQMRNRGLVAECESFCLHCGPVQILLASQRFGATAGVARGFAYVDAFDPPGSPDGYRVPIVFGTVADDRVTQDDPAGLAVGEVVGECLSDEGIRYTWDRVPGSPILILAEESVTGIPASDHHETALADGLSLFRSLPIPEDAFDRIDGTPVRLLNLVRMRRLGVGFRYLQGRPKRPRVGDYVKLGFAVQDAKAPELLGDRVDRLKNESMWVEVTRIGGTHPNQVFRGELMNVPQLIDPAKLRVGSPVTFRAEHVYPAVKRIDERPSAEEPKCAADDTLG
jgi:hypothetical protein